jgi:hypothetical protein
MAKALGFALDQQGFDKMVKALSPENRKKGTGRALRAGAVIVQDKIRGNYKKLKPKSDLDAAIVVYEFPSGEGAVVRRFYQKGAQRPTADEEKKSPFYRAYILNFIEKGATDRKTKGKGKIRNGANYQGLNRGSIPATKFFRKGFNSSKNRALKEIERILLIEIAKQAKKG